MNRNHAIIVILTILMFSSTMLLTQTVNALGLKDGPTDINQVSSLEEQLKLAQEKLSKAKKTGVYGSGNETTEGKSFLECYSSHAEIFFELNLFTPYTFNLTDPKMKQLISDFCNYIYEKSGLWVIAKEYPPQVNMYKYTDDFWNQYPEDKLPSSIKSLISEYKKDK